VGGFVVYPNHSVPDAAHSLGITGGGYGVFLIIVGAVTVVVANISPVVFRKRYSAGVVGERRY
jgi:hypothetical protein